MPLFTEGFLNYFNSSQFCDMTLVVCNKEYKTHRIILVYNSGYFAHKLSKPKYLNQRYVHYVLNDITDPNNLFPQVLKYVYDGRITIADENCVPLLALANSLEIEDLKKRVATFLSTKITRKNVLYVLQKALEFNTEEVKNKCLLVLARNFSRIVSLEPEPNSGGSGLNLSRAAANAANSSASASANASANASASAGSAHKTHHRSGSNGSGEREGAATPSSSASSSSNASAGGSKETANATSATSATPIAAASKHRRTPSNSSAPPSTSPVGSPTHHGTHGGSWFYANATGASAAASSLNAAAAHDSGESPFKNLPIGLMLMLLNHGSLAVMSEYLVYRAVCDYIKSKGSELTSDDCNSLFETVRFPYLNYHQLKEVTSNPLVPQRLLAEALIVRLGNFEAQGNSLKPPTKLSLQKRITCGMLFDYTSDFDEKGILYWIATQGHTADWANPSKYGVKVSSSSVEKGNLADVLEIRPAECWTKDVPSSWFAFDLGKNRQIVLTHYTLRHGSNSRQDCLRNWVLQCSDDGVEWETIKRHVNEVVLNANFASASWPVMCLHPHRWFRVLQTGHNSTNKNFFSLSGIEFYGDFYEKDE